MNNLWNVSIKKPATEYKNEYKIHDINTRPSFKPDNYYKALREPIQEETTNRHDYVKHKIERIQTKQRSEYNYPKMAMEKTSSYNNEFTHKNGERPAQVKHNVNEIFGDKSKLGTFDASATYKSDYRQWNATKTEIMRPDKLRPSNNHFDDETTYSYDYIPMNHTPRSIMKPDKSILKSAVPFNHRSGYAEDYITPDKAEKRESSKEKIIKFRSDTTVYPIPNNSGYYDPLTNSMDSMKWHLAPIKSKDLRTSYNSEYTKKDSERLAPIRPFVRKKPETEAKFDSDSTYSMDFRKWSGDNKRYDFKTNKFTYW